MNYSEWESALIKELKGMPTAEYMKITSYYREMYGDKLDAGMSEEAILAEFGSPKSCAEKIIAESGTDNGAENIEKTSNATKKVSSRAGQKTKNIILAVLFSLFAGIPLAAVLVSIVVSLGAVCISCGAGVLASFVYIFVGAFTATGAGIAAHIGMAIGAIGVCGFLGIGGYFATKYSAIYSYKLMKIIYGGILK
jgi:uncharacterized membrane protein